MTNCDIRFTSQTPKPTKDDTKKDRRPLPLLQKFDKLKQIIRNTIQKALRIQQRSKTKFKK